MVKPIETNEIAMGDVITYQIESGKPGVITHRITGITNSSDGGRTFTLQGDNNDVADELQVIPIQVVGKLWYSVPWIGNVSNYVNGDGRSWLVPVVAIALFIYAGFMIMSGMISSARKRKLARTKADDEAKRAAEQQEVDRAAIAAAAAAAIVVSAAPATKPVRKTARKPAGTSADKAVRKPARTSAENIARKPTATPTEKAADNPAVKPVRKRKPTID